jgi:hypothetical protein
MARSFGRTRKWLQKFERRVTRKGFWRSAIRAVGLDLVIAVLIAVGVLFGVGSLVGYVPLTPTLMIFAAPDIAFWIYAIILFFAVRAVVRALVIAVRRSDLRTRIDAGARESPAS